MTTPIDKIKYFEAKMAELQEWIEEERAKMNPPEPLECWVVSSKTANRRWLQVTSEKPRLLPDDTEAHFMREVTPQDEQDRKDAARYREAKKMAASDPAFDNNWLWWKRWNDPDKWDDMLDKALEEE